MSLWTFYVVVGTATTFAARPPAASLPPEWLEFALATPHWLAARRGGDQATQRAPREYTSAYSAGGGGKPAPRRCKCCRCVMDKWSRATDKIQRQNQAIRIESSESRQLQKDQRQAVTAEREDASRAMPKIVPRRPDSAPKKETIMKKQKQAG